MRICIYGAGAMGTSLGALLEKAGTNCELVSRNKAHIGALIERGAVLEGAIQLTVPVTALLPEEMQGEYDVIILATRQNENEKVAAFLKDYLTESGVIITVQNGLPEEGLKKVFRADRVYGCTLSWSAECSESGTVTLTSESGFHLALGVCEGEVDEKYVKLLSNIGCVTTGNLTELRFAKLAVNASFSTLSTISGLTFYEIAKRHRRLAAACIREVFSVARAYGCKQLPLNGHNLFSVFGKFAFITLPIAMKPYKKTRSGMLSALQKGRYTDVDFVAGAVIQAGEAKGVPTPVLQKAVEFVHGVENGLYEISEESLTLF